LVSAKDKVTQYSVFHETQHKTTDLKTSRTCALATHLGRVANALTKRDQMVNHLVRHVQRTLSGALSRQCGTPFKRMQCSQTAGVRLNSPAWKMFPPLQQEMRTSAREVCKKRAQTNPESEYLIANVCVKLGSACILTSPVRSAMWPFVKLLSPLVAVCYC